MKRKEKNFMRLIIAIIAVYITAITATANVTKNITLKDDVNKKEVAEKNLPKTTEKKDSAKATEQKEVQKDIDSKKAVTEKVKEDLPKTENVKKDLPKEIINYSFANKMRVPVYNNLTEQKVIDKISKGTRVEVLATQELETVKKTKHKKKDGTFEIQLTSIKTSWTEVRYEKDRKTKKAWIKSDSLAAKREDVLAKNLRNLDFKEIPKKDYPNNPKRNDVKGIYVSSSSAGYPKRMKDFIQLTKESPINAFVIDVKDDSGIILFKTEAEKKYLGANRKYFPVKDIKKFVKTLKDNNIYLIARIVSFKDPRYSKLFPAKAITNRANGLPYTKKDGVRWVTAYDRNLWEYNIAIAKEAAAAGFDEIQFDYVRFPASNGGKLDKQLDYKNYKNETKPQAIQEYLKYARKELEPLDVYVSADVYGQVGSSHDDMGLGQYWEGISNVVDYISPMEYPSHYGKGVYGLQNPDANPYKTVYYCTLDGINRNANIDSPSNIRPWIQAFTAPWVKGHITYGKPELKAQIKALKDLGINEYLLWNASNKYEMARY